MADYIIFGGVDSRQYGIYVFPTESVYSAAEREYQQIQIPGRNGDLVLAKNRFKNVDLEYQCAIPTGFKAQAESFRNALLAVNGYARLVDSFNSSEYCTAIYRGPFEPGDFDRTLSVGTFTIKFNRKPQRFLLSGEEITTIPIVNQEYTITNPTRFSSRPLIEMAPRPNSEAISTGYIAIGETTVTMTNIPADVGLIIDCEMMDVYGTDGLNYNSHISLSGYDFPVLHPGPNGLTRYNVGVLSIKGRWFVV